MVMSQDEFAQALGVTSRAVQKWESGNAEPHPKNIRAMSELTGHSPSWFLGLEEAVA
jgi:DNA-binding transcriptional regulator YiaG